MKTQILTPPKYSITSTIILHFILISLTLITACSIFKEKSFFQADSLRRQELRKEVKTESATQTQSLRIYNQQDSSDKQSYTEIFPDGLFRYSHEEGFLGTAKKLLINERLKEGRQVQSSARVTQTEKAKSESREKEKLITKTSAKEKAVNTSNYTFWYLAAIAMLFVGIYFFRNVFRER